MPPLSGATQVCFMVGLPVAQARTPAVFNDWASRTGRDVVMAGLALDAAGLPDLFAAMRHWQNCAGVVVTYPHKQAAFALLDEADAAARFNRACNVVRRDADGRLIGTMTDGVGCVAAMQRNGACLKGADLLLVGAGGAGSAIAHEAARRGVARLVLHDQDAGRLAALVRRLTAAFGDVEVLTSVPEGFRHDIACNATPLGMNGEDEQPWPVDMLAPHTLVVDVVPTPAMTPWLKAARSRGLKVQTGPEMVAAQFGSVAGHLLGLPVEDIESAPLAG